MTNSDAEGPSDTEIDRLVDQVDRLVLPQANIFLRELLRDLGLKLRRTKEDIRAQLVDAITEGALTEDGIDVWLRGVEGWGNQHVYAFGVPDSTVGASVWRSEDSIAAISEEAFPGSWRALTSALYPDDATLTRIDYDRDRGVFIVEWHQRTASRHRVKAMDSWPGEMLPDYVHPESVDADASDPMHNALLIDGDTYWFDAFRLLPTRVVMRFAILLEPKVGDRPIAALFLRTPVRDSAHARAMGLAWQDLGDLTIGRSPLARISNDPWSISTMIKRLDTDVVRDRAPGFKSRKTRFSEGLATVEFTAPPDFELPEIIAEVRLSIPQTAIDNDTFLGSEGDFRVEADPARPTSRTARIQLFQSNNRIRIWTELDEPDVWTMLETLDGYR
jgi:hypothetical protein